MTDRDRIKIKKRNRRIWRYAFLSSMLLISVFLLTACTQSLFSPLRGDNRKAYDLIVKASEYFTRPATVRIVSGEISDGTLYCVIKAQNRYGYNKTDSFQISQNGYPSDSYSSRCRSRNLDCDIINDALQEHFYVSIPD